MGSDYGGEGEGLAQSSFLSYRWPGETKSKKRIKGRASLGVHVGKPTRSQTELILEDILDAEHLDG